MRKRTQSGMGCATYPATVSTKPVSARNTSRTASLICTSSASGSTSSQSCQRPDASMRAHTRSGPAGETSETTACRCPHRDRAALPLLQTLMPPQEMSSGTDAGRSVTQSETRILCATTAARAFRPGLQHGAVHGKSRICEIAKLTCALT